MITENDIIYEIKTITEKCKRLKRKTTRKEKNRIRYLRQILWYIETKPNEKSLIDQLEILNKRLESAKSQFDAWYWGIPKGKYTDPQAQYERHMKIPDIESKIKTLRFILR